VAFRAIDEAHGRTQNQFEQDVAAVGRTDQAPQHRPELRALRRAAITRSRGAVAVDPPRRLSGVLPSRPPKVHLRIDRSRFAEDWPAGSNNTASMGLSVLSRVNWAYGDLVPFPNRAVKQGLTKRKVT
jgi:hypothetical protein